MTMIDHANCPRGTCSLCGTPISSATAAYCLTCYRRCLKTCGECMENGRLKRKYQRHKGLGMKRTCNVCGEVHEGMAQAGCPACGNDRSILVPTRPAPAAPP